MCVCVCACAAAGVRELKWMGGGRGTLVYSELPVAPIPVALLVSLHTVRLCFQLCSTIVGNIALPSAVVAIVMRLLVPSMPWTCAFPCRGSCSLGIDNDVGAMGATEFAAALTVNCTLKTMNIVCK